MAQQRNNAISIAKGFAIIFVVMAHADMPGMLNRAIYLFHMPLFFITAVYFFKHETVENPWPFIVKRFKGLYVPFVKWSIFFLLIHNLLFKIGILNEVYGNWTGGTTHPYSIHHKQPLSHQQPPHLSHSNSSNTSIQLTHRAH